MQIDTPTLQTVWAHTCASPLVVTSGPTNAQGIKYPPQTVNPLSHFILKSQLNGHKWLYLASEQERS